MQFTPGGGDGKFTAANNPDAEAFTRIDRFRQAAHGIVVGEGHRYQTGGSGTFHYGRRLYLTI